MTLIQLCEIFHLTKSIWSLYYICTVTDILEESFLLRQCRVTYQLSNLCIESVVDSVGRDVINEQAQRCRDAAERCDWEEAKSCWSDTQSLVLQRSHCVDFYNILKYDSNCYAEKFKRNAKRGTCNKTPL